MGTSLLIKQLTNACLPTLKLSFRLNTNIFCYVYNAGIISNGLGIPRAIVFYDESYFLSHPEIIREKKSDSPAKDKSVGDNRLLLSTLKDFFKKHPLIHSIVPVSRVVRMTHSYL